MKRERENQERIKKQTEMEIELQKEQEKKSERLIEEEKEKEHRSNIVTESLAKYRASLVHMENGGTSYTYIYMYNLQTYTAPYLCTCIGIYICIIVYII